LRVAPSVLRALGRDCSFHAARKGVTAEKLCEYDVVLTTYPVVEAEYRSIINATKVGR
jgi:hypothetical protein